MVDILSYTLISITCFCFGLIVSFQFAHITYCRKLTTLLRRSISTRTIAPVLADYEALKDRK
ncbi:MAG: hypothetical protein Q7V05_03760 [Methanoregula sp.]|nr:hypothetical protein [Methanoregula sp.]MDP2795926.1 hypothetical protein [Methanoregula sp.]